MQLAVLNAGGNDREQRFPDAAGRPGEGPHAPINYHAYAACTRGGFFRRAKSVPKESRAVLVLLANAVRPARKAIEALKAAGKTVAISWKESGLHQVARRLDDPTNLAEFRRVAELADGALSSTPQLVELYRAVGCKHVEFLPTPYPVDDPRWNFGQPLAQREGVFVGTREWDVPTRRHAEALLRACALGAPVTVCNVDGRRGRKLLRALGADNLRVLEGRRPYGEYLRAMAACRVVFQLDESAVPGQVAGDALLCRMPCIGGNGAIDQIAFGDADLGLLLRDDGAWQAAVDQSQAKAARDLAFAPVATRLRTFFQRLGAPV